MSVAAMRHRSIAPLCSNMNEKQLFIVLQLVLQTMIFTPATDGS